MHLFETREAVTRHPYLTNGDKNKLDMPGSVMNYPSEFLIANVLFFRFSEDDKKVSEQRCEV